MTTSISKFETISRTREPLSQPPSTIETLSLALQYIKNVLTDDVTQTLVQQVTDHLATFDITAHYVNSMLLSDQMFQAIRHAFVTIESKYCAHLTTTPESVVPNELSTFLKWLLTNPSSYTSTITDSTDRFNTVVTLASADEWFSVYHDDPIDVHQNSLVQKLNQLLNVCQASPVTIFDSLNFRYHKWLLVDGDDYQKVMELVAARLIAAGSPLTIEYMDRPDTTTLIPHPTYTDALSIIGSYFTGIYPYDLDSTDTNIVQLETDLTYEFLHGGADSVDGYLQYLADYGETDGIVMGRTYLNYYHDHMPLVLGSSMSPEYQATMLGIRGNVNTNYCKVFNVFTVLNKSKYSISLSANIGKLAVDKTLDLLNLVSLSKSLVCLCLVPYTDVYGVLFNRLVVSFDNYNPAFTATLLDAMPVDVLQQVRVAITSSKSTLTAHINVNGVVTTVSFSNTGRMYDVAPFFMFAVPRIAEYQAGTIRLSDLRIFGQALNVNDAVALIAGFTQSL